MQQDVKIESVESLLNNSENGWADAMTFANIGKLILRDLNGNSSNPVFSTYTKDDIVTYLKNPYINEKNLRDAIKCVYAASPHFRRLIQYFVSLNDLSYVVSPYKIDTSTAKKETIGRNYRKVLNALSSMDIKNQFPQILTVCVREDTFYGCMHVSNDSIIIQQLPSDYCKIAVIEDGVMNVSFDFSYFDSHITELPLYTTEFDVKYKQYQNDRTKMRWQELDAPTSFAIKCSIDIPNYSLPPFVGLLRDLFDINDYRDLKMTKAKLENYAILAMRLGRTSDGGYDMDLDEAKSFWRNLDHVLPEEVGSVLTPMDIQKISFEKSNTSDVDNVSESEQHLFSSAGVSSLLFNNEKASANALLLSIKTDQSFTYGIVKSIETALNRYLHRQSYGKNFKVTFLDCSPFNRKEVGDAYIKACSYGMPMISYYCASQGLAQEDIAGMNLLETEVLQLTSKFQPLQSSATMSSDAQAGRPPSDISDLTEKGEQTRELA